MTNDDWLSLVPVVVLFAGMLLAYWWRGWVLARRFDRYSEGLRRNREAMSRSYQLFRDLGYFDPKDFDPKDDGDE